MKNESIGETVEEVVKGKDEPVGEKHPEATWSFIWLVYPLILVAVVVAILLFSKLGG